MKKEVESLTSKQVGVHVSMVYFSSCFMMDHFMKTWSKSLFAIFLEGLSRKAGLESSRGPGTKRFACHLPARSSVEFLIFELKTPDLGHTIFCGMKSAVLQLPNCSSGSLCRPPAMRHHRGPTEVC